MTDVDGHRDTHPAPRGGWPTFRADGSIVRPGEAGDREVRAEDRAALDGARTVVTSPGRITHDTEPPYPEGS